MSTCDKYQEMISALLDGELTEAEQADIRSHIASCEDCRAMYEAFAAVSAAVSAGSEVPESLHDGIMARVHAADKATKTLGQLISMRRILTAAACLVVIVGTVLALRNNLFPRAESADAKVETGGAVTLFSSSASAAPADEEMPVSAMQEETLTESAAVNSAVYGAGEDMRTEEAPAPEPATEPASAQSDSAEGIPTGDNGAVMQAWLSISRDGAASVTALGDVDALCGALMPQETELSFDPGTSESDCVVTLDTGSGPDRTLQIYFDSGRVWVGEDGTVYLASCTQEEFEALR